MPISGQDWDAIAGFEFRKLVEKKAFVSVVYSISRDDEEPVLELSLCDTSGDSDVFVAQQLIEKDLAVMRDASE